MRRPVLSCLIFRLLWVLLLARTTPAGAGENVRSVEAFEAARIGGPNAGAVSHWKWREEEKRNAKDFSRIDLRESEGAGGQALAVSIHQQLPEAADFYTLWTTGCDYLPPGAVALRMRARVVSGRFTLTAGSATAYFANSDVWACPQVLEPGDWRTIEFSLVSGLQRNFRRAVFSAGSPVIHYTRWIQEPLRIMVGADSLGELLLDDIELVLSDNGGWQSDEAGRLVRPLAAADLSEAFTFATDDKEFDLARTPGKEALRKPAVLHLPQAKGDPLEAHQRGLEEMSFLGIPVVCPEGANAFRVTMKVSHKSRLDELVVDFLALVAGGGTFPWSKARTAHDSGFDFCLSPARTAGVSWGFYHARRIVPNGDLIELILPFGDFLCAYGSGTLHERHQLQQPLRAGEVVAIAMVSPFRQAAADTLFTIQSVEAVRLEK